MSAIDTKRLDFIQEAAAELVWVNQGGQRQWLVLSNGQQTVAKGTSLRIAIDNAIIATANVTSIKAAKS